ncbi:MAG: sugar ABC transporter permease [Chloroflexia bacterium]|jgi:ABC-type sugar transport system permease subunit|nr:sugar ABC transporter permease [Chloroflexia bacterium]
MSLAYPVDAGNRSSQFRKHWVRYRAGYLFLFPAFVLYAVFMIYPFFQAIYLSLTDWNGAEPVKNFVGLENYRTLWSDSLLWDALRHNLIWVAIGTIGPLAVGFLLAVLLASRPKGFTLFRTAYFLPQVLSPVVIGLVWSWIYNPLFGVLNVGLDRIGLEGWSRGWLGDPQWALYAVLMASMWAEVGFVFVVFLAGLQNVNRDLIEAATLDGANAWRRFWDVTLPQMANVVTVVAALLLIGGFSAFDIIFVMTGGGPANATDVIATYAYTEAFTQNNVGYASALTLVMTVITLVASVVFIRFRERGED